MPRRIAYAVWSPGAGRRTGRGLLRTWTLPWWEPGFAFADLVPWWEAETPDGSWIEVAAQAGSERGWHTLACWQAGPDAPRRTSPVGDPEVDTDTWRPATSPVTCRLRVRLQASADGRPPVVRRLGAVVAAGAARATTSAPLRPRTRILDVPRVSQLTWAEEGGRGWCSPTAVAMVLAHAGTLPATTDSGGVDVAAAAREVFDPAYDGTGNWPFNTAWAATVAGHAFVTRLRDLRDAERFVDAGIPLVASVAYAHGDLPGAPTPGTDGHLLVVRGFTAAGDVVTNDPAAPSKRSVRRTYRRAALERAWLDGSGGLAYVIHRADQALPKGPWLATPPRSGEARTALRRR